MNSAMHGYFDNSSQVYLDNGLLVNIYSKDYHKAHLCQVFAQLCNYQLQAKCWAQANFVLIAMLSLIDIKDIE